MNDGESISDESVLRGSADTAATIGTGLVTKLIKAALACSFLMGFLLTGLLGTETRLLFFWPGAALIGTAGVLAAVRWRWRGRLSSAARRRLCCAMKALAWSWSRERAK